MNIAQRTWALAALASLSACVAAGDDEPGAPETAALRGEVVVTDWADRDPDLWPAGVESAVSVTLQHDEQLSVWGLDPAAGRLLWVYVTDPDRGAEVGRELTAIRTARGFEVPGSDVIKSKFPDPPPGPGPIGVPPDPTMTKAVLDAAGGYLEVGKKLDEMLAR